MLERITGEKVRTGFNLDMVREATKQVPGTFILGKATESLKIKSKEL